MDEQNESNEIKPKKRLLVPLLLGLGGAILLGGGGFYATYSGLLGPGPAPAQAAVTESVSFVAMEPLVVSLGPGSRSSHLRFTAELEVPQAYAAEVTSLMPRIRDVMNSYLHALELRELEEPGALVRLRSHMLRRIQIVTSEKHVRDLLVTEFILN